MSWGTGIIDSGLHELQSLPQSSFWVPLPSQQGALIVELIVLLVNPQERKTEMDFM